MNVVAKEESNNPFANPATSTGIQWEEINGRLLLIEPSAVETSIPTVFGDKEAVRADVAVIDGDGSSDNEYRDTLIFPGVLISQTRSLLGQKVLGRLSQGNAKPGQKPPWVLKDADDKDIELAKKYLAERNTVVDPSTPPF